MIDVGGTTIAAVGSATVVGVSGVKDPSALVTITAPLTRIPVPSRPVLLEREGGWLDGCSRYCSRWPVSTPRPVRLTLVDVFALRLISSTPTDPDPLRPQCAYARIADDPGVTTFTFSTANPIVLEKRRPVKKSGSGVPVEQSTNP